MMRKALIAGSLFFVSAHGAADTTPVRLSSPAMSSSQAGACLSTGPLSGGCWESRRTTGEASPDVWRAELDKARKAGEACQADIDKFCEGVQVGEGRIDKCLKAHKAKLSKKCRTAQGWR